MLITDRPDWKLRLKVDDCVLPKDLKEIKFIRETYNNDGELTDESTYQFFLTKRELINLSNALLVS
jgi:hypothetical protein